MALAWCLAVRSLVLARWGVVLAVGRISSPASSSMQPVGNEKRVQRPLLFALACVCFFAGISYTDYYSQGYGPTA